MWGPHAKSHETLRYFGQVTNKKRYISTFTRPMDPKLSKVLTQMRGPHLQNHVTHRPCGHARNQNRYIFTFTRLSKQNNVFLCLYKICSISPNQTHVHNHVIKTSLTLCYVKLVHKHWYNRLARLTDLDLGKRVIALDHVNTK